MPAGRSDRLPARRNLVEVRQQARADDPGVVRRPRAARRGYPVRILVADEEDVLSRWAALPEDHVVPERQVTGRRRNRVFAYSEYLKLID
jgi:hypothetical protein